MKWFRVFLAGWILLLFTIHAKAQQPEPAQPAVKDSSKPLDILHADRLSFLKKDSTEELQMLVGHVKMRQGKTLVDCDSAVYDKKLNTLQAFGNVHINDNDTVQTYSDYIFTTPTPKRHYFRKR